MVAKIFIDGEAGTTGLQIRERLANRRDLEVLSISPDKRKDQAERRRLLNAADVAILCLPDDAAKESVALIENETTRVIDASTAFRVDPVWAYGFAEMDKSQSNKIANARFVANPGCWPHSQPRSWTRSSGRTRRSGEPSGSEGRRSPSCAVWRRSL